MAEGAKGVKSARFDLLPVDALWHVALVFGKGAEKYADRNWERGLQWSKSYGALQRHLALWWARDPDDPETHLSHMAHAAWHCLVLLAHELRVAGVDDRPNYEALEQMVADLLNPEEIASAQDPESFIPYAQQLLNAIHGEKSELASALAGDPEPATCVCAGFEGAELCASCAKKGRCFWQGR